jgi:hypothetical protein
VNKSSEFLVFSSHCLDLILDFFSTSLHFSGFGFIEYTSEDSVEKVIQKQHSLRGKNVISLPFFSLFPLPLEYLSDSPFLFVAQFHRILTKSSLF